MATVTINTFTITKNFGNADFVLDFDVHFDELDQVTNMPYKISYRLIEDDTGEDQDDGALGDDLVGTGWYFTADQTSNGLASRNYHKEQSIAWSTLNEDGGAVGLNDDEIRMKVTLEPRLPVVVSSESSKVVVNSP